jgi:hypothetical protein
MFGRRKRHGTADADPSSAGADAAAQAPPTGTRRFPEDEDPTLTDWADLDTIRAEWPEDKFESQDRLGYDNGIRLSGDPGMPPLQRLNYAEYITRGLRHALYDDGLVSRDEAAIGVRTILEVLEPAPGPDSPIAFYLRRRSVRLALALAKLNGWQPVELGGDGTVVINSASPIIVDAIRFGPVPDSESVQRFFS